MSVRNWGLSLLFLTATSAVFAQGDLIDKVAAVVGNEIILQSEIELQALQMTQGAPVNEQARSVALEGLLFEKLLLNQARLDSVEVSEEYIAATIDQRIQYYVGLLGSEEAFEEYYGKSITAWRDEFHDPIKEQLMAQQFRDQLSSGIAITPGEVIEFFETIPQDSLPLIPEELWYSQIARHPEISKAQEAGTRARLDSIRSSILEKPYRWNLSVIKHTQDPGSKSTQGCYRGIQKGTMVPEFEAAVFNTPVTKDGDIHISEVFKSEFGYHILKVEDRRGNVYDACHILIRPEVTEQAVTEAETRLKDIVRQVRADSLDFRKAAVDLSTDEKTSKQEGRVINPASGDKHFRVDEVDPQLFFLLDKLEVGEISDPFYHTFQDGKEAVLAIRLDGRRKAHTANLEDDYLIFKQQAEALKRQTELETWVRKELEGTYVRIDDEYAKFDFTFPWLEFQESTSQEP